MNRADLETASRIEHKIAQVVALLNDAIRDNEITTVQKVKPTRAAILADQMAEMQKSLRAVEVTVEEIEDEFDGATHTPRIRA